MAPSGIVSEIKPDIGRKSRFFHTPPAIDAPDKKTPSKYLHNISYAKPRLVRLPEDTFSRFQTILAYIFKSLS